MNKKEYAMKKMDFVRSDFKEKFTMMCHKKNLPVMDKWFQTPFQEDDMIENFKSEDLKKRMIIQEASEGNPLHFDAFTDKGGENYEYDDLYIQAVSVNEKIELIFDLYQKWFIENLAPDRINEILHEYMIKLNPKPVYIETELAEILEHLAAKNKTDMDTIVNQWIRKDIELIQTVSVEV